MTVLAATAAERGTEPPPAAPPLVFPPGLRWVPVACGLAAVFIGGLYPLAERAFPSAPAVPREWATVMRCLLFFAGIAYASVVRLRACLCVCVCVAVCLFLKKKMGWPQKFPFDNNVEMSTSLAVLAVRLSGCAYTTR
jgi:hypothetical protein